jgi:TonB family protein
MTRTVTHALTGFVFLLLLSGCGGPDSPGLMDRILDRDPQPDSLPVMLNPTAPFKYPQELYAQKVQGNVSLRLFIDVEGKVHAESTAIVESSGHTALDSAAMIGSRELTFSPARRRGRPMAVSIIYPVLFRHPEAPPLPGDSLLKKGAKKRDST